MRQSHQVHSQEVHIPYHSIASSNVHIAYVTQQWRVRFSKLDTILVIATYTFVDSLASDKTNKPLTRSSPQYLSFWNLGPFENVIMSWKEYHSTTWSVVLQVTRRIRYGGD